MKKLITVLSAIVFSLLLNAQSVKLFGYEEPVSKGIIAKRDLTEDGREIKRNDSGQDLNYYLYLTYPKGYSVEPVEVWIHGKGFSVNPLKINKTPVTIINHNIPDHPVTTTLIPKNKNSVCQILPEKIIRSSSYSLVTKSIQNNDLVVLYKCGKRWQVIELKKLKPLALSVRQ